MITTIFTTLLASSVLLSSQVAAPKPVDDYSFTQVLPDVSYSKHVVIDGDSLTTIAGEYYGDEAYWTTVWNDNSQIENPTQIEKDWILNIRASKPTLPDGLKPELSARLTALGESLETIYSYSNVSGVSTVQPVSVIVPLVTSTPAPQATQPAVAQVDASAPQSLNEAQINYLGSCEAGMDPAKNTGNGYYGAFQFSAGTWNSMGTGYARADLAPIDVQKAAVQRLVARSSIYTQFPGCARKMSSVGLI